MGFLQVVIINGYPTSGKDTFVTFCEKHQPANMNIQRFSTIYPAKEAFKILGWNGEKTAEVRDGLSAVKDLSVKLFDSPFKYIEDMVNWVRSSFTCFSNCVVFVDSREPEEIERFKKDLNAIAVMVDRPVKDLPENHADNCVYDVQYDFWIDSTGSLEELEEQAKIFIQEEIPKWMSVL